MDLVRKGSPSKNQTFRGSFKGSRMGGSPVLTNPNMGPQKPLIAWVTACTGAAGAKALPHATRGGWERNGFTIPFCIEPQALTLELTDPGRVSRGVCRDPSRWFSSWVLRTW